MRPLHVLLADDDPSNREVATIMMTSAGHRVTSCETGTEALERCLAQPDAFDLVMLDIMMPGLDGLSVARHLRHDPRTRQLPIVCVSARASVSDQLAGHDAGCTHYLTKPYKRRQLLEILDAIATDGGR